MRRLLLSIAFVLIVASRAWSDCSTLTPNLGLAPCTVGTSRSISDPAWINNFKLLDINAVAPLAWIGAGSISPQLTLGTVVETLGGTGQITYTKGDTLYASATNTLSKLNGNTTTTRKFREQHGNGTAVTVDAWDTIQGPDITSGTINPARIIGTVTNNRCVHVNGSGALVVTSGDCASNLVTSGSSFDASGADYSIPWKIGTTTPGTCGIGQAFFDTDATAGSNIYACTASNVWTLEGGGGGSGDITDVGSCTTGACFTSVAQNLVLASPTGSTGAVTSRSLINADLPDTAVTGTTCGDTTHSCGLTYNSKGLLTAVTNNVISGGSGDITDVWTATSGNVNALTAASGDTLDAGSADSTRPNKTGTTAPGTCSVGDTFFDSDATAGNNVYGCTATNTWTLEGDGGGAGAGDITDVWNTTSGNVNALTAASGDSLDASGADTTKACKTGTSPPGTCSQGECFVDTDAAAAAQLLICTATNTWTAQGNAVTVLTGAGTSALTGGATTDFVPISGFAAVTQTDGTNALRMPAGTFTALGCALSSTMSTGTYTISLRKNGVDQSVTFPITVQTGSDTAHSFSTSNNDNVSVSIVPSSSPTTGLLIKCWSKFSPS